MRRKSILYLAYCQNIVNPPSFDQFDGMITWCEKPIEVRVKRDGPTSRQFWTEFDNKVTLLELIMQREESGDAAS